MNTSRLMRSLFFLFIAVCAGGVYAAVTAKSYVQRGLVSHWDAIENAGYGTHDNAATVWTDLKGYADLDVVNNEATWTADSLVPPQKGHGAIAADLHGKIALSTYQSVDTCLTRKTLSNSNAQTVFGRGARAISWQQNGFICHNSGTKSCLASLVVDTSYSIYAAYSGSTATVITNYLDAVPIVESDEAHQALSAADGRFEIGRSVNEYWSSRAPVNSIRLYSRALEPWEILVNSNVDKIRYRSTDGAALSWPEGLRYGDSSVQYRVTATTVTYSTFWENSNQVRLNDGAAASPLVAWKSAEAADKLYPVPDANHQFYKWEGDVDGLEITAEGVVTLDNKVRALTCCFTAAGSAERTWTGAAGDGDWTTAGNWDPAGAPGAGDLLTVPSGRTVILASGADTPVYYQLDCAGTLVLSNWNTRLRATDIRVRNGGIITAGDASFNAVEISRVNLDCATLTVDAGGRIDASEKGYLGPAAKAGRGGYGPGASTSANGVGASHGGYGARWLGQANRRLVLPYGSETAPETPGSSGSTYGPYGNKSGNGGGVVRISATGAVTVNGSILADGGNGVSSYACAGSGGSVWITSASLAGSGTIRAKGGNGVEDMSYSQDYKGMPAGGGRIAIDCDGEVQTEAAVAGMKISADCGHFTHANGKTGNVLDGDQDLRRRNADIGTVYFSDAKLVHALLGKGLTGQLVGLPAYTHDGDLAFTSGRVRFATVGVRVKVNGNLAMSGTDSRLELGGGVISNNNCHAVNGSGRVAPSLEVTGGFTLGGVSRFDVYAAATNGTEVCGALVAVGGAMTVATNTYVYAWSDIANLGAPRFVVGSFAVDEGGVVSADYRGGRGTVSSYTSSVGGGAIGPGRCNGSTAGGGHGGVGGGSDSNDSGHGLVYDDVNRPMLPGSGGGHYDVLTQGGAGGGAIIIFATNGAIRVDGRISADGECPNWFGNKYGGGGSGGTIFLECASFSGAATGVLSARGGDVEPCATVTSGAGGGGRIAVWCGVSSFFEPNLRKAKAAATAEGTGMPELFTYGGSVSVAAGAIRGDNVSRGRAGHDGTIRYVYLRPRRGMVIFVQ